MTACNIQQSKCLQINRITPRLPFFFFITVNILTDRKQTIASGFDDLIFFFERNEEILQQYPSLFSRRKDTCQVFVWEMALTGFKAFIFCSFSTMHQIPNQHTVELMDSGTATGFFRSWWRYNSVCMYTYIYTHTILIRLNHQTSLIDTHARYDVITRT